MRITAAVTESKGAPFALQELELGELRATMCSCGSRPRHLPHRPDRARSVVSRPAAGRARPRGSRRGRARRLGGRRVRAGRSRRHDASTPAGTARPARAPAPRTATSSSSTTSRRRGADGTSVLSRDGEPIHAHFFGQSSFATHAVAGARNVVRLPDGIGLDVAAPFGCGIQTGAGAVLNSLRAPAGSSIAVFGTGTVGLAGGAGGGHRRLHHDHRRRREPLAARARARARRDARDRRASTRMRSSASPRSPEPEPTSASRRRPRRRSSARRSSARRRRGCAA